MNCRTLRIARIRSAQGYQPSFPLRLASVRQRPSPDKAMWRLLALTSGVRDVHEVSDSVAVFSSLLVPRLRCFHLSCSRSTVSRDFCSVPALRHGRMQLLQGSSARESSLICVFWLKSASRSWASLVLPQCGLRILSQRVDWSVLGANWALQSLEFLR